MIRSLSHPARLSLLALALAAAVSKAHAQNAISAPDSARAPLVALDTSLARTLLFAPSVVTPPKAPNLPPFAPREPNSKGKNTLIWAGMGALVGGVGGYLLFSPGPNDCDTCAAIAEGTAIEGAIIFAGVGALVGGVIGFIRGGK